MSVRLLAQFQRLERERDSWKARALAAERLSAAASELERIEESADTINRQWDSAFAELFAANQAFMEVMSDGDK